MTPAGDRLTVYTEPAPDTGVVTVLRANTVVRVLDGPVEVDGQRWWRLSTEAGTGWAPDGAGGTAWLVPSSTGG